MNLNDFKANLKSSLKKATVVFLINNEYILLGMKKRGFGVGKWNGVGGKLEPDETFEDSAIRETEEEIGVKLTKENLEKVAILNFYFPEIPIEKNFNQNVYAYFVNWKSEMGEPQESEEISPKWFKKSELPFEQMWDDDKIWLPKALVGERFEAEFSYSEDLETGALVVAEYHVFLRSKII